MLFYSSVSIYNKYFGEFALKAEVRFKSMYGNGEPTDAMIDALLEDFRKTDCTRIIAIGGGAVIDMAKILMLDGNASAAEYFQRKVPLKRVRPLIAVPTTCGAGSESSNVSIAEILSLGTKLGLADNTIFPDYAVLIPTLLSELPYNFFATSAIDALIHAIESYVSPRANLYTRMFSEKAMEMILKGFQDIVKNGPEYRFELLDEFLIASSLSAKKLYKNLVYKTQNFKYETKKTLGQSVTISCGIINVKEFSQAEINRADQMMYKIKHSSKNLVKVLDE